MLKIREFVLVKPDEQNKLPRFKKKKKKDFIDG